MKSILLCTTLAAALFTSTAAVAADPDKKVAPKPPSERMEALNAVSTELMTTFKTGSGNPIPYFEKLVAQPHSPAVSAQVRKAFGVPALISFKSAPAAPGMVAYSMDVPAQKLTEVDGESMQWAALESKAELDKDGRKMVWSGTWPSFSYKDEKATVTLTDMTGQSVQQRNNYDVWIGKATARIGQMLVTPADAANGSVVLEAIDIIAIVAERGNLVDVSYDANTRTVRMFGEQIDGMRVAVRMTNIDMKAFEAFSLKVGMNSKMPTEQDLFAGNKKEYIALVKSMAARGSTLEIEELGASFRGHKVVIAGRVSVAPLKDADFKTATTFARKIIGRLDIKAPVGLVTEVAAIMTRQQAKAKGQVISDEAVAQTAQMITDGMLGKLTAEGFVTLEDGMLSTRIEYKGGTMKVNNKLVELPKGKPAPKTKAK